MKIFHEGDPVYVVRYDRPNHTTPYRGLYAYAGYYGNHYVSIQRYGFRTNVSFQDNEVFGQEIECRKRCVTLNRKYTRIARMSDEEYNDYDFSRYLSRYFKPARVVKEILSDLHKNPDYANLDIKIVKFDDDDEYKVYWRVCNTGPKNDPDREADKKGKEDRTPKEEFLMKWTPLYKEELDESE